MMMADSCTYRQTLRAFVKYRDRAFREGWSTSCITAHDVASESAVCSLPQVRKHLARAEREGLVKTRVMKTEHAKRHRRRRVPLRVKCYIRVPGWRRRG